MIKPIYSLGEFYVNQTENGLAYSTAHGSLQGECKVVVVVVVSFFNKNFDNHKATLALKHLKHKTQYRPERCT